MRAPFMRTPVTSVVVACLASYALAACGGAPPAPVPPSKGPAVAKSSTSADRESVGITVYNSSFGLVREVRNVALGRGRVALEYRDVSSQIEAETVHIRSIDAPSAFGVLEQNYRYDLLTPQKLLEKYEGKRVKVYRWNEATGRDEAFDAEVLSTKGDAGPVLKIGNDITYGFPGRIAFPDVPPNLIAEPTLVWMLDSGADEQKIELTYLTRGISWRADYVFTLSADDAVGDLTGWVTLANDTGTSYENASLKLVAGDVQRVTKDEGEVRRGWVKEDDARAETKPFNEEGLFEYHLYTLDRPTTVLDKESKQVTLLEGHDIAVAKHLIFFGSEYYYRGSYGEVASNQKVGVYLDIQNAEANHLGIPLPKGIVRVYKADKSGAKQFVGEDAIDHTPRDEKLRIKLGDSFDVVGDRKQTDWKALDSCVSETAWEIALRNHKDTPERVEVYEPIGGDWEIVSSSQPYVKKDANTFTFDVAMPARGETKVTYRARVRWC
jgi:hypothetical protein